MVLQIDEVKGIPKGQKIRTPINGKFNDVGSVGLVIKKLIF